MIRKNEKSAQVRGYVLGCIGSCAYGLNPLFAKPLYAMGLDVASVLLYRYGFAALLLWLLMAARRQSMRVPLRCVVPLLCAGVLFAVSSLTLFESYHHMDVGIASTILYVTPVFVALILAVFYHQRLSAGKMGIILLAMGGIGMLSIKADSTVQSLLGIGFVLASALSYAIYMVMIDKSVLNTLPTLTLTFYNLCIGVAVYVVKLHFLTQAVPLPLTVAGWGNALGLAVFPTVISLVTMTIAVQDIGPVYTAILGALEPLTAIVVGCVMFGEVLTGLNVCGVVVVLVTVTLLVAGPKLRTNLSRAVHRRH
jgi:drug/metabolite transporter (DMT)-like permease